MGKHYIDEIKNDLLRLINKGKKTKKVGKEIDEERYQRFIEQLNDVTNPATSKIGPLDEKETYYLRKAYKVVHDDNTHYIKETHTQFGIPICYTKDYLLWLILTKIAYYLKKDNEITITKKREPKRIELDELEIHSYIIFELKSKKEGIFTVEQVISYSTTEIYGMFADDKVYTSVDKYMLYELYEVIHDLGFAFAEEEKRNYCIVEKENDEELLEKEITEVYFESLGYSKKVYTYLHKKNINKVRDLVSLSTKGLATTSTDRYMYRCIIRTMHMLGLAFKDEMFITIEPKMKKMPQVHNPREEIEEKQRYLEDLIKKCRKKEERKEALKKEEAKLDKEIEEMLALIKEEKNEIAMLIKENSI